MWENRLTQRAADRLPLPLRYRGAAQRRGRAWANSLPALWFTVESPAIIGGG